MTERVAIGIIHADVADELADLRVPPCNRLEKPKGDRHGQRCVRINNQWRICFRWKAVMCGGCGLPLGGFMAPRKLAPIESAYEEDAFAAPNRLVAFPSGPDGVVTHLFVSTDHVLDLEFIRREVH